MLNKGKLPRNFTNVKCESAVLITPEAVAGAGLPHSYPPLCCLIVHFFNKLPGRKEDIIAQQYVDFPWHILISFNQWMVPASSPRSVGGSNCGIYRQ
jgi:hypothetical protein